MAHQRERCGGVHTTSVGWCSPGTVVPASLFGGCLPAVTESASGHGRAGQCQLSAMVHPIMLSTRPSFRPPSLRLHSDVTAGRPATQKISGMTTRVGLVLLLA